MCPDDEPWLCEAWLVSGAAVIVSLHDPDVQTTITPLDHILASASSVSGALKWKMLVVPCPSHPAAAAHLLPTMSVVSLARAR